MLSTFIHVIKLLWIDEWRQLVNFFTLRLQTHGSLSRLRRGRMNSRTRPTWARWLLLPSTPPLRCLPPEPRACPPSAMYQDVSQVLNMPVPLTSLYTTHITPPVWTLILWKSSTLYFVCVSSSPDYFLAYFIPLMGLCSLKLSRSRFLPSKHPLRV